MNSTCNSNVLTANHLFPTASTIMSTRRQLSRTLRYFSLWQLRLLDAAWSTYAQWSVMAQPDRAADGVILATAGKTSSVSDKTKYLGMECPAQPCARLAAVNRHSDREGIPPHRRRIEPSVHRRSVLRRKTRLPQVVAPSCVLGEIL